MNFFYKDLKIISKSKTINVHFPHSNMSFLSSSFKHDPLGSIARKKMI